MTDPQDKPKPTITPEANAQFKIVLGEPSNANVPAVKSSAGGLTYQNAHDDERTVMDKWIASIDLTNTESVIAPGSEEREELAKLSDQLLDSIQPSVRLAFAEALKALLDTIKVNSLSEIKKRIADGTMRRAGKALWNAVSGKNNTKEVSKEKIERFMTELTGSRKTITEMTDKLHDQQVELEKNYTRINQLGVAMVGSAQRMRVIRAAVAEFIRRVDAGEIAVLTDLQKTAEASGRADDAEKLRTAQSNWNAIRTTDANLLGSISVYDMNVANLAFTKDANTQNRMQTANALTNTIAEWKAQLAMFGVVMVENSAAQVLNSVDQLTAASVQQNKDLFDTLVDSVTARTGKGMYSLRQLIEMQDAMATKLESVGPIVEAQFAALDKDKAALEASSAKFRERVTNVYSNKNGILSAPPASQAKNNGLSPT